MSVKASEPLTVTGDKRFSCCSGEAVLFSFEKASDAMFLLLSTRWLPTKNDAVLPLPVLNM